MDDNILMYFKQNVFGNWLGLISGPGMAPLCPSAFSTKIMDLYLINYDLNFRKITRRMSDKILPTEIPLVSSTKQHKKKRRKSKQNKKGHKLRGIYTRVCFTDLTNEIIVFRNAA